MLVKSIYTFSLYSLRFLLFIGFIMCFFNINFNCFELMLNTEIYYDLSILNNYIYKYLLSISLNSIVINCFFIEIFLFFCGLSYIKLVIRALKHFEHEIIICQRLIMKIKLHLFLVGFFFFNPVLYQTLGTFGNNFFVIYNFIVIMKFISYFFYLLIFFFLVKYCQKNNFSFKIEFFFLYYFILYFTFIIYHIKNFLLLLICLETIFFCLIFIFTGLFLKHKSGTFTGVSINSATYASAMQLFFYKTHNYFSIYGTLMYFIYNAFALAFYLFSLLWFFIMSNNLGFFDFFANFRAIFLNVETSMLLSNTFIAQLNINVILFICFIFFCFFLFKLGIFPFHFWVVKILTSLNYISLMILFVPYKLIIYFFFLIFFYKMSNYIYLQFFFLVCSAFSIIIGALGMYLQYNIRKFIAYSTVTHAGYILTVMACGTFVSFKNTILYIIVYIVTMYAFFLIVSFSKNFATNKNIISFLELSSLATYKITIWKYFIILLFSMIGIPPLAGFWAKIGVLESLLQLNTSLSLFLMFIIIATTVFTTIGYLRIIKLFFIKNVYNINLNKIGLYNNFIYLQIYFCTFFLIFFPIIWNNLLQVVDFVDFYLLIHFNI